MSESLTTQSRIESRIDKDVTGNLSLGANGSLAFANLNQIMEVAKVMAISQAAIPKHLRENVGACLAIAITASEWQLSPFAVANKSYVVNDRLAYEAQLIAAVILRRAPIKGRIKYKFQGDGGNLRCTVSATLIDGGEIVDYTSPEFDRIPVKNSPLWKSDPEQQLGYFSVRAMCRRHFPDVLLGIYTADEIAEESTIRDITPTRQTPEFLPQTREESPEVPQDAPEAVSTPPDTSEPVKSDPAPAVESPKAISKAEHAQNCADLADLAENAEIGIAELTRHLKAADRIDKKADVRKWTDFAPSLVAKLIAEVELPSNWRLEIQTGREGV